MGHRDVYAQAVELVDPETIPAERLVQQSILDSANSFLADMRRYSEVKPKMEKKGIEFGGRVLLIGPPGTDFDSFTNHISVEMPLRIARFRLNQAIGSNEHTAESIRVGFETARRNKPCLLQIRRIEALSPTGTSLSALMSDEIQNQTWDTEEVIIVASTSRPDLIERDLLALFDRVIISNGATLDDRVRVIDHILKGRTDFDPAVVTELTEGWSFADVKHLAISLFMSKEQEGGQFTIEQLEQMIDASGVHPIGKRQFTDSVIAEVSGEHRVPSERLEEAYPDDFLDQLYLEAVGENYTETQRVIETLNSSLPLSAKDIEFLGKYPFILSGTSEERLMRLLKAKKSSDKLRRIMGRQ